MRQIKIGFSRPKKCKLGSELIQMWSNAPYSHVFSQFSTQKLNISCVYHASHGMVHFKKLENFTRDNDVLKEYIIDLTDDQHDQYLALCMNLAGEGYGYSELLKIVIHDILFTIGITEKLYDGKGYICSELVGKLCTEILGITFKKPTYLLTPKDIDQALEQWTNNRLN